MNSESERAIGSRYHSPQYGSKKRVRLDRTVRIHKRCTPSETAWLPSGLLRSNFFTLPTEMSAPTCQVQVGLVSSRFWLIGAQVSARLNVSNESPAVPWPVAPRKGPWNTVAEPGPNMTPRLVAS